MNIANRQPNWAKTKLAAAILPLSLLLGGCGDDNLDPFSINAPNNYEFSTSVNNQKAITRLILIKELDYLIASDFLQQYGEVNGVDAVIALLNRIYEGGTANLAQNNLYQAYDPQQLEVAGPTPIKGLTLKSYLPLEQTHFSHLSANVNLKEIMPGIARQLDNRQTDNELEGDFIGWFNKAIEDEDRLADFMIQDWFSRIATLATDGDLTTKHRTAALDYRQLISGLLLGATYYQANEHIDNLLTSLNSEQTLDLPQLQREWDMVFGYYGASKDLKSREPLNVIASPDFDSNQNQSIDVFSEMNFNYPIEAITRDADSPYSVTQFALGIQQSLLNTRTLLDQTELKQEDVNEIFFQSNKLRNSWEQNIAATTIHYIKDTIANINYYGLGSTTFDGNYAKSWANLKTFALSLQFYKNAYISLDDQLELHKTITQFPESSSDYTKLNAYAIKLYETREQLKTTYKFSEEDTYQW